MRFSERYRPAVLGDVRGQPAAGVLGAFAQSPYASCWLLEGPPGTGKTSAALALASGLNSEPEVIVASDLSTERTREILRASWNRPMFGGWRVLMLEEVEWLHPQVQTLLKTGLETQLAPHCIVVATSNDASGLQPALRQRFNVLKFWGGSVFADACKGYLGQVWAQNGGSGDLPKKLLKTGGNEWSLREALDLMQVELLQPAGV